MKYPSHLLKLIDVLKKLPGVGTKSAERFAFDMINWREEQLRQMAEIIVAAPSQLIHCGECGSLTDVGTCPFCENAHGRANALCIVAAPRDVFAIEATHEYSGLYHVLGVLLSPIDGIGPEKLKIEKLKHRIAAHQIGEVVIALDSTLEGDATALYLKQELEPLKAQVSRLAFGLPMGSSFDYVDGGTLARALSARNRF
jgi:recombination protein RecR